jgi:hypothetical protein
MSITVQFTVTTAGRAAAWNANSTGIDLALTHIQLGSGNRVPNGAEVALVTPQQKATIGSGFNVSDTQIRMSAIFTGALAYAIREVGIWAGDPAAGGILFGYWSQASGSLADKSANLDLVFSHDMILDASLPPGSVTVVVDTAQAAMIADHESAADPHPQYLMLSELPYESVASNIKVNGTQSVGTRNTVVRGDHVHPTDTSRLGATANAVSASKLLTARTISLGGDASGSASFDGSANATITANVAQATKLRTARTISLTGDVTGSASFDGSANATIAATGVQAAKLKTARTITLSGAASGSASFDGSANIVINVGISNLPGTLLSYYRAEKSSYQDVTSSAWVDVSGLALNVPVSNAPVNADIAARVAAHFNQAHDPAFCRILISGGEYGGGVVADACMEEGLIDYTIGQSFILDRLLRLSQNTTYSIKVQIRNSADSPSQNVRVNASDENQSAATVDSLCALNVKVFKA